MDATTLLVSVATDADQSAFAELFKHFAPRLKTYYLRGGLEAGTAEDLAQEVMAAVWKKSILFDRRRGSAAAWIFTIARNLRTDRRRQYRGSEVALEQVQLPADIAGADDAIFAIQSVDRLYVAIGELPPEQAEALRAAFLKEQSHGEIAETSGLPLGTVKSRIRMALKGLRAKLRILQ